MSKLSNPKATGIPFAQDEEVMYLSPNSAEGKALQRMKDIDDPSQWVTVLDENEEINLDELNESLRELGYGPIAIPDQES